MPWITTERSLFVCSPRLTNLDAADGSRRFLHEEASTHCEAAHVIMFSFFSIWVNSRCEYRSRNTFRALTMRSGRVAKPELEILYVTNLFHLLLTISYSVELAVGKQVSHVSSTHQDGTKSHRLHQPISLWSWSLLFLVSAAVELLPNRVSCWFSDTKPSDRYDSAWDSITTESNNI